MKKSHWTITSVILDALLANAAVVLAFYIRFGFDVPLFNFTAYLKLAPLFTAVLLLSFYVYDLYNVERLLGGWNTFFSILKACTLTVLLLLAGGFLFQAFSFPRSVFVISWVNMVVLLSFFRLYVFSLIKINWPKQNVLIVGNNQASTELIAMLDEHLKWGINVCGVLSSNEKDIGADLNGTKIIGTYAETVDMVRMLKADRIIFTDPAEARFALSELTKHPDVSVKVEIVPEVYEILIGRLEYNNIEDIPLIEVNKGVQKSYLTFWKTGFDLLLALVLTVLLAPLFLIVAIVIKLTSKGPVFYLQERVGKAFKPFKIIKFRTMIADAEKESGPVLAAANDPRTTRAGAVLRKYHIDELPQIYNVLSGQMSFIGPRPERPVFVEQYMKSVSGYGERYRVKPGITGLAQISGYYASDADRKLKFDLMYIYNPSFLLDLKILLRTAKILLSGKEY